MMGLSKMKRTFLVVLVLLLPLALRGQGTLNEMTSDFRGRISVGMDKKIVVGLEAPTSQQNRLSDEADAYHLFPVLCERRDAFKAFLNEKEIGALIYCPIPLHKQL